MDLPRKIGQPTDLSTRVYAAMAAAVAAYTTSVGVYLLPPRRTTSREGKKI